MPDRGEDNDRRLADDPAGRLLAAGIAAAGCVSSCAETRRHNSRRCDIPYDIVYHIKCVGGFSTSQSLTRIAVAMADL
jgi:hypothetical protein